MPRHFRHRGCECQEALSIALTPSSGLEGGFQKTHNGVRKAADAGCGVWLTEGGGHRLSTDRLSGASRTGC